MGKKTERIADLKDSLEAAHTLIRSVGELLNISRLNTEDLHLENVRSWIAAFTAAFQARGAASTAAAAPPAPAPRVPGSWATFDEEVDAEIERMKSRDLVPRTPTESSAMVASGDGDSDSDWPQIADIASVVGVDVSREASHGAALSTILRALEGLKNPGDVAGETAKGDSLVDAVRHGRDAEHEALGNLRSAREALARIASAMQIPNWDPANPESAILDRVQHWDGLKHLIRRRIGTLESGHAAALEIMNEGKPRHVVVIQELKWVLTQIIAPIPLAKFLGKMPAEVAATSAVTRAAESPGHLAERLRRVTVADLRAIPHGTDYLLTILQAAAVDSVIGADLITFLNLVVLPLLRTLPSAG